MSGEQAYLNSLSERIIGCAFTVGNTLGHGFLEKVYEKALAHELTKSGMSVVCQEPIKVHYDGIVIGDFYADLLVASEVIVELKAVSKIDDCHLAQCLNYLKATDKKLALLINFGKSRVQIKRVVYGL